MVRATEVLNFSLYLILISINLNNHMWLMATSLVWYRARDLILLQKRMAGQGHVAEQSAVEPWCALQNVPSQKATSE
jgi:hypothetical protein